MSLYCVIFDSANTAVSGTQHHTYLKAVEDLKKVTNLEVGERIEIYHEVDIEPLSGDVELDWPNLSEEAKEAWLDENEEDVPPVLDRPTQFKCGFCGSTLGLEEHPDIHDYPRCKNCGAC